MPPEFVKKLKKESRPRQAVWIVLELRRADGGGLARLQRRLRLQSAVRMSL